jgi:hypothetical protein
MLEYYETSSPRGGQFSVAKTAAFFPIGNHSGLALMPQTVKKTDAATTFQCGGERSVKVFEN